MTIVVLGAGLQTTIQDLGRPAHQRDAVPAGGAMDRLACRAANLLVGNDEQAAVLEATLMGPTLQFHEDTLIALAGGNLGASVNGVALPVWRPILVPAGGVLRFGHAVVGCRAYVAVAGGIDVPVVFGSRSTYLRGAFGGVEGRALRSGDVLHALPATHRSRAIAGSLGSTACGPDDTPVPCIGTWSLGVTLRPSYGDDVTVRVIAGAHADLLTDAARAQLLGGTFRVSSQSDRMGYRLEGEPLALAQPTELLSEGVAFGTVQLPPGGAPIVLMADRQTTGGYPRIAEVISVDLPLVAQLKPGDRLRFRAVSIREAQRRYLAQEAELSQARAGLTLRFPDGR